MNVLDYLECKQYVELAQMCIVFNWITMGMY